MAGSDAKEVLQDGDMILAVNDNPVSCFSDIERMIMSSSTMAASGVVVRTEGEESELGSAGRELHGAKISVRSDTLVQNNNTNSLEDVHHDDQSKEAGNTSALGRRMHRTAEEGKPLCSEDDAGTRLRKKAKTMQSKAYDRESSVVNRIDEDKRSSVAPQEHPDALKLTIFRNGRELEVDVSLGIEDGLVRFFYRIKRRMRTIFATYDIRLI